MKANPTIKEIARHAGVSFSVTAAVLRNKKCNIRFSKETSLKVNRAARELDYHPNRLAQAMASGKIPLVAVSLHLENINLDQTNYYTNDNLLTASMALHKVGFEMIFLPYADHDEQLERLRNLVDGRLVSGVVSNFIADENKQFIDYMKSRNTPYIILGNHPDQSLCRVIRDESRTGKILADFAVELGCRRVIQLGKSQSHEWEYREYERTVFNRIDIGERDFTFDDPEIMFVTDNDSALEIIKEKNVSPSKIVVIDDYRRNVTFRPAILIHPTTSTNAAVAVEMLLEWINSGVPPKEKCRRIGFKAGDIEILR